MEVSRRIIHVPGKGKTSESLTTSHDDGVTGAEAPLLNAKNAKSELPGTDKNTISETSTQETSTNNKTITTGGGTISIQPNQIVPINKKTNKSQGKGKGNQGEANKITKVENSKYRFKDVPDRIHFSSIPVRYDDSEPWVIRFLLFVVGFLCTLGGITINIVIFIYVDLDKYIKAFLIIIESFLWLLLVGQIAVTYYLMRVRKSIVKRIYRSLSMIVYNMFKTGDDVEFLLVGDPLVVSDYDKLNFNPRIEIYLTTNKTFVDKDHREDRTDVQLLDNDEIYFQKIREYVFSFYLINPASVRFIDKCTVLSPRELFKMLPVSRKMMHRFMRDHRNLRPIHINDLVVRQITSNKFTNPLNSKDVRINRIRQQVDSISKNLNRPDITADSRTTVIADTVDFATAIVNLDPLRDLNL